MMLNQIIDIINVLADMPEEHLQFVLGYAAGVSASTKSEAESTDTPTGGTK